VTAAFVRARSELRARFASMLALAILLGLGSGVVLTLAAGARRTDSSYTRFARQYLAADMLVFPPFDPSFADLNFDEVSRLPQVVASGRRQFVGVEDGTLQVIADDGGLGVTLNRIRLLEGRLPHPDSLDEAAVSFPLANERHLRVGSSFSFRVFDRQFQAATTVTLRIVGIEAAPGEFPPQLTSDEPGKGGFVRISPALIDALKQKDAFVVDFLLLRFRQGAADFAAVNDELSELAGDLPQINQNLGAQAGNVERSIHLQAVALRIVAGLVTIIGLLVLSQLIARQAALDATETPTLLALGMTRREVALSGLWRYGLMGLAGGVIAMASAFLASPLMPIGTARVAEPNGGFSFDILVLPVGALGTIVVFLAMAAGPLWRSTKRRYQEVIAPAKPSLVARAASIGAFPPAVGTGVRLALEPGHGRTEVPVRSSLLSVALAIVALAGALTFAASLDHLLNNPRQYGWNWDLDAGNTQEEGTIDEALKLLENDPMIEAAAGVDTPPVRIEGVPFDAIALSQGKGTIEPIVVDGRAPRAPDEVALGVKTLHEVHAEIGTKVHMTIAAISGGGADFTVVGTVVIPPNSDTARLGGGGVITYDGEKRMAPPSFTNLPPISSLYIRLAPGVDPHAARERLEATLEGYVFAEPTRPVDLVNFGQVQNLPLLLAGLVAVLAAATLGHTLITAIRRRRRDLAILKMIGFVPRQVRSAVSWQATTFVSAAMLIGLPVGIVVGRLVWTVFAHGLGTIPEPVSPWLSLLLTIPGAVVLANLIAAVPAVIAGRMRPAPGLRAE
jgi:hypothetical protein